MTAGEARVSIVIPARNEGEQIRTVLDRIQEGKDEEAAADKDEPKPHNEDASYG